MSKSKKLLTVSICTYNRSQNLQPLISLLRKQQVQIPFEILIVNNNSTDNTIQVLEKLRKEPGVKLRFVTETQQGIPYARNRAVSESLQSDYMFFMDDDEEPVPGLLEATINALMNEDADCAGGKVQIAFESFQRPSWLSDSLLGFLAEIDHGPNPFWITDISTPLWTANIAYNMKIFRSNPTLRFDHRYNRIGNTIGGGSDSIMFKEQVKRKFKIRYRPDMVVRHHVEKWRIKRSYFLKLHYLSGKKKGMYEMKTEGKTLFGISRFMYLQLMKKTLHSFKLYMIKDSEYTREAMNASHLLGQMIGLATRPS